MNNYVLFLYRTTNSFVTAVLFCFLMACEEVSVAQLVPIQRVARLEILYPEFSPYPASRKALDVVNIDGKETQFVAKDTRLFRYDAQQRLTNYDLTQIAQTDEGKIYGGDTLRNTFSYSNGRMKETEGGTQKVYDYPLDNSQLRVLAHTKSGYSYINIDTLRQYSPEGILTEVYFLGSRQVSTVEAGNVTRIEQYNVLSGKLEKVTSFVYDKDHDAPPAQLTYLGETSRQVVSKQTVLDYSFADGVHTYVYTYQNKYDDQGRMSQQVEYIEDSTVNQGKPYVAQLRRYYY